MPEPAAGQWRFVLTAEDHAEHVAMAELTVTVEETGGSTGSADGTAGDGPEGGGESSDDSGGASEGDATAAPSEGSDDAGEAPSGGGDLNGEGCSCRGAAAPRLGLTALLLFGFVARRRAAPR